MSYVTAVYELLASQFPQRIGKAELYERIDRNSFQSPPRFENIAKLNDRFVLFHESMELGLVQAPPPQVNVKQRSIDFYSFLRQRFSSSFQALRDGTVKNAYVKQYGSELYYTKIKRILKEDKKLFVNDRSNLFFEFMQPNMEKQKELRQDKHDVAITLDDLPPSRSVRKFIVENHSTEALSLNLPEVTNKQFMVVNPSQYPKILLPNLSVEVEIFCTAVFVGLYVTDISFQFALNETSELFTTVKSVTYSNQDDVLREVLKPIAAFQKRPIRRPNPKPKGNVLSGAKPTSGSKPFVHNLEDFRVPQQYYDRQGREIETELLDFSYQRLKPTNTEEIVDIPSVYSLHYRAMLFFEELQVQEELDNYASEKVTLVRASTRDDLYWLDVPGLAEKRPSVLRGDEVEATVATAVEEVDASPILFRGYVWKVEQSRIQIHFHTKFGSVYTPTKLFNVRYLLKRTNFKIMHDSLLRVANSSGGDNHDLHSRVSRLLFPTVESNLEETLPLVVPMDNDIPIQLNDSQRLALQAIVSDQPSEQASSPFILFGPPGTGKTHTVVAAVTVMVKRRPSSKILLLAPSNQAADLLIEKLSVAFTPSQIFRLMAYQREPSDVSSIVKPYCYLNNDEEGFIFPPIKELEDYQIIVSTCSMSAKLFYYGFPANWFSTIIIDESGHCWEPEAIAAFMNFYTTNSTTDSHPKLVLAGDPKQLGPVVRSDAAKTYGLALSFLERLSMNCAPYLYDLERFPNTAGYDPHYIVQLQDCYRCHPEIIALPNRFFYHDSLRCVAHPTTINTFENWEGLPNPKCPIIFHGCIGENEQESNSPSWFNTIECEIVVDYIRQLQAVFYEKDLTWKDIGIITPYHKQVQKLRKALVTTFGKEIADQMTIGSCEQFQGQERKVIIISTVRSSTELLTVDEEFNIGFVKNPKRFNVAITRAQALLIVVGNPLALQADHHWGSLLWHSVDKGCYRGSDLPSNRLENEETENIH